MAKGRRKTIKPYRNERRMKMKKEVMKKKGEGGRDRVDPRLLRNSRCSKVDEHSGLCGSWEEGEGGWLPFDIETILSIKMAGCRRVNRSIKGWNVAGKYLTARTFLVSSLSLFLSLPLSLLFSFFDCCPFVNMDAALRTRPKGD